MSAHPDSIRARLSADAPQAQVVSALLVVAGAQAGLPVDRIDDAVMGADLLLGARRIPRTVGLTIHPGAVELAVSDVDAAWLEGQRQMLEVLATAVIAEGAGVRLRVEP
ncbi:MAG TPA: hypothetical protein VFH74_05905 [Gaiellales bacterium]|nr:hypothetical protein [Gaiellales bacterium]